MNMNPVFKSNEASFYRVILDFLEEVYIQRGPYQQGDATQESSMDVLILNFTKVVNDCRAILLLSQSGFYIQAGIIVRSTIDSCNLMMHIAFEGDNAPLFKQWLIGKSETGKPVTHWKLVERLNERLKYQLNVDAYRKKRKQLDNFVHANYQALRLYPIQSPGPTPINKKSFRELIFWKGFFHVNLVSCLLIVSLIVPDLGEQAGIYLNQLMQMHDGI